MEALFSKHKEETLTNNLIIKRMVSEDSQNQSEYTGAITDPPFYVPRGVQELQSNAGESELREERKDQFNLPFDDDHDLVNQNSPRESERKGELKTPSHCSNKVSSKSIKLQPKFSNFSASSLSDDRWLCPICLDIFYDAVETPCCNNLFCFDCIKQTRQCPLCNKRITGQLKPNIPIRRLVMELSIPCTNDQCSVVVRKCDLEKHLDTC